MAQGCGSSAPPPIPQLHGGQAPKSWQVPDCKRRQGKDKVFLPALFQPADMHISWLLNEVAL